MLGTGKSAWKGFSVDQGILVDRNISRGKPQELTVAIGFNWWTLYNFTGNFRKNQQDRRRFDIDWQRAGILQIRIWSCWLLYNCFVFSAPDCVTSSDLAETQFDTNNNEVGPAPRVSIPGKTIGLPGGSRRSLDPPFQAVFNQTTHKGWRKCHDDILAIVKKLFFFFNSKYWCDHQHLCHPSSTPPFIKRYFERWAVRTELI